MQANYPRIDLQNALEGERRRRKWAPRGPFEWLIAVSIAGILAFAVVSACRKQAPAAESAGAGVDCWFLARGELCFFICEGYNSVAMEEVECAKVPTEDQP